MFAQKCTFILNLEVNGSAHDNYSQHATHQMYTCVLKNAFGHT